MDEYISRKDAIKELHDVYEYEYPTASGDFDEYANHDVPNVLRNIPTADVQPVKHGRWVECCNELDKKCSCCDKVHGTIYEREPFCPNCGARMDGEQND